MKEISLHLLDIVQNSVKAGAAHVDIRFHLGADGILEMGVKDDGCGMSPDFLARVRSPFTTTRTTRKVGLGIPLLMQNAMQSGGRVDIESEEGVGTEIVAYFVTGSIDCLPLGDLPSTMASIIMGEAGDACNQKKSGRCWRAFRWRNPVWYSGSENLLIKKFNRFWEES